MPTPLSPIVPAGAYDDLLARVLPRTDSRKKWEPSDGPMPSLFVSHGAPPTLDDPQWLDDLYRWGRSIPTPNAIVVVSAHWEDAPIAISGTAAGTPLYYDFGGFHPRYYTLRYETPDSTDLGRRLAGLLGTSTVLYQDTNRGLDHGAFIPLMAMYPEADVPVVQLSMPSLDPQALLTLGQQLKPLRDEGVLVIGSGFMTHSFAVIRDPDLVRHTTAFDEWAADSIGRADIDSMVDFYHKAPGARVSHPTADHFVPLLLAIGAADNTHSAASIIDRMFYGNSIRSLQFT
ncbi:dioxygenase [Rhodococcus sp. 06-621-2]|nr:class III extradiol ring-cleavage dioxygenase [Rhodococcus sp. 06-621-2]OZC59742.1 dioxygenase [Rhodococcus sp. 06-621-2]